MQWTGTWHTKTWLRRLFTTLRATNGSCIGANTFLALQLWKNFLIKNSTNMKMIRTWRWLRHYGSSNIDNLYSYLQRIQKDFDWCYWWLNKTFLYRKAKNYQFLIQYEIQSYHWIKEYYKLYPLVLYFLRPDSSFQHYSPCFCSMTTTISQAFWIVFKQCLFIILKLITHI